MDKKINFEESVKIFPEKDKKNVVERLRKRLENHIPKKPEPKSVEYQLGFMIGEYIVEKYLPTIDIYSQTNHTINVSEEDRLEYERLDKIWFDKYHPNENKDIAKNDWFNLRTFGMSLEKKYLPHILKCYVYPINVKNIIDLKKGIRDSLWDCDKCCYKIETDDDIIIESEEYFEMYSIVKLNLDIDKEIVY